MRVDIGNNRQRKEIGADEQSRDDERWSKRQHPPIREEPLHAAARLGHLPDFVECSFDRDEHQIRGDKKNREACNRQLPRLEREVREVLLHNGRTRRQKVLEDERLNFAGKRRKRRENRQDRV